MYKIEQVTGNLVLITPLKVEERKVKGLYVPNTKGKHTVCKVIAVGNEVTNDNIKKHSLVLVPSILISEGELDRNMFDFEEEKQNYYLIQQYGIDAIVSNVENKV